VARISLFDKKISKERNNLVHKALNNYESSNILRFLNNTPFVFFNHFIIGLGAYGPSMRLVEPSVIRKNPALDRLPASRVARGGKGYLPVNQ
jgi:hypothetical protein